MNDTGAFPECRSRARNEPMARRRDEQKHAAIQAAVVSAAKAIAEPAAFRDNGLSRRTIC
jgi:hypothetical protein